MIRMAYLHIRMMSGRERVYRNVKITADEVGIRVHALEGRVQAHTWSGIEAYEYELAEESYL